MKTYLTNWPKEILQESINALSEGSISKVRKALNKIRKLPDSIKGKNLRLGIVRTFTIETQLDFFTLAISMLPSKVKIKVANIENIEQELLNHKSDLLSWQPDIILVLWRLEEIIPRFYSNPYFFSIKDQTKIINKIKRRINNLINGYTSISNCPLILSTMPMPQVIDICDINNTVSYRKTIEEINSTIFKCNSKHNKISLFDFNGWSSLFGKDAFDRKMDFFARQPISANAIGSFVNVIARSLRPFLFSASKAIALDADNILWGGILGEDGIHRLKIGYDFPGNIYRRIQEFVLKLKHRGILLSLLSKNNFSDVEKAFSTINDMPLKLSDFNAVRVNWNDKFINLKKISENLGLGLESFVFVDDQPFEQEQMNYNLPQVKILKVSADPLSILSTLEECWFFDKYTISNEDQIRNIDYTSENKRKYLKKSINNTEKFLKTLDMKAIISDLNENNIYRAFQMLIKTNQFNVRTQRHSESQLRKFFNNSRNILLTVSLSDRFGDQGIIGLIIGVMQSNNILFIDSFLLSCRALGRGAENVLWYVFLGKALKKNISTIRAEYIYAQKNSQVSDLFDRLGMIRLEKNKINISYELNFPHKVKKPNWIKIINE